MDPVVRKNLIHEIHQTTGFYGKSLEKSDITFWLNALESYPPPAIHDALLEYTKVGKFAPRPAHIIEILDAQRTANAAHKPAIETHYRAAPPEVSAAWLWFLGWITQGSENLNGLFDSSSRIPLEIQEQHLVTVNRHAHKHRQPEAIPKPYWLADVWGCECPHNITA